MDYLTEDSAAGCPMELFLFLVISLIFVTLLFSANALEHRWLNAYLSPFRLVLFIPIISLVDYLEISHCSFQSAPLHPDLPPPKKEWKKKKSRENKAKQVVFVLFIYYLEHGRSPSGHPSKERCIFVCNSHQKPSTVESHVGAVAGGAHSPALRPPPGEGIVYTFFFLFFF